MQSNTRLLAAPLGATRSAPSRRALLMGLAALPVLATSCASRAQRDFKEVSSLVAPTWDIRLMEAPPITSGRLLEKLLAVQLKLKGLMPPTTAPQADFVLFNAPQLQAMAMSYQRIGMTSALVLVCQNDGQIAAFLSQRIACLNLVNNDAVKMSFLPRALFDEVGRAQTSAEEAAFEAQADIMAIETLARTGYDPRDALELASYASDRLENNFLPKTKRQALISAKLKQMGYQI